MNWEPIETAPKDESEILAIGLDFGKGPQRHYTVVHWNGFGWEDSSSGELMDFLTHWQPLPEPPKP